MRLYDIHGNLTSKNVTKYLIDWRKNSRSKLQTKVKRFLQRYWKNQTIYEEFPVFGTKMKVDFLNSTIKVAIEVQGTQHRKFNPFFHSNSRAKYLSSIKRDMQKATWLEQNNFTLVELEEREVKDISKDFFRENFNIKL